MAADISVHGFFQGNYSSAQRQIPTAGDSNGREERVQLRLDAAKEPFRLFIKTDAFYDHIDEKAQIELREGYIDYIEKNGT